jgi:membrane-associated phospholipid phosphatase
VVGVQVVLQLDRQMTLWINQHHNRLLDMLFGSVSRLGDAGVAWLVIIALLLMFGARRDRIIAIIFLCGLMITEYIAAPALRDMWYRPRPFTYMESIRTIGPEWQRASFPSSHAHLWGQAALLFAVAYPRLKLPLRASGADPLFPALRRQSSRPRCHGGGLAGACDGMDRSAGRGQARCAGSL